jgi:hypothetical protein
MAYASDYILDLIPCDTGEALTVVLAISSATASYGSLVWSTQCSAYACATCAYSANRTLPLVLHDSAHSAKQQPHAFAAQAPRCKTLHCIL